MTPRYRVCGLGADGLLVDMRAAAAADAIVWRGPYAVAVELAGLSEQIEAHARALFDADVAGRELGRALVQARSDDTARGPFRVVVL